MTAKHHGESLYYANDKNIYDALRNSKMRNDDLQKLFIRRNIVCSRKTPRDVLALEFSRLTHDLKDHQAIAKRLGITTRRERLTALGLIGEIDNNDIANSIAHIKAEIEAEGGIVRPLPTVAGQVSLEISYTEVDYRKSEFSQVQHKDGIIEIAKEGAEYIIRNTHNDYIDDVRDKLLRNIQSAGNSKFTIERVELSSIRDAKTRSRFFSDLTVDLPGFDRFDVVEVYVYKPKPSERGSNEEPPENAADDSNPDIHVERVLLRGNGVSRSKILHDLTQEKDYYISKVAWISVEKMGSGHRYEIEAMFTDPPEFTAFSYILRGVYELSKDGNHSIHKRMPEPNETALIARVIEKRARELVKALHSDGRDSTQQ